MSLTLEERIQKMHEKHLREWDEAREREKLDTFTGQLEHQRIRQEYDRMYKRIRRLRIGQSTA